MLSDMKIRSLKAPDNCGRHLDGNSLYIYVTKANGKSWQMRYRFAGKETILTLGRYPDMSLKDARTACLKAHVLIKDGINPNQLKRERKIRIIDDHNNSFDKITEQWFNKVSHELKDSTLRKHRSRLNKYLLPALGKYPITAVTRQLILEIGQTIQKNGAHEEGRRVVRLSGQILEHAVNIGLIPINPAHGLTKALIKPEVNHHAAPIDPDSLREVLRKIATYNCSPQVTIGLQLIPHLFTRPRDLVNARWENVDFNKCEWRFVTGKTDTPMIIPLSRQVIQHLRHLHVVTGDCDWVFPHAYRPDEPMSSGSLLRAIRKAGVGKEEATIHGFRASARTLLNETLGYRSELCEMQIAHVQRDPNGRAYNRTQFLPERKAMMQAWSDYLDGLVAADDKIISREYARLSGT